MSIPTPATLKALIAVSIASGASRTALAAMRMRRHVATFRRDGWRLSNGRHVSATVARILTFDRRVVGVGDSCWRRPFANVAMGRRVTEPNPVVVASLHDQAAAIAPMLDPTRRCVRCSSWRFGALGYALWKSVKLNPPTRRKN